MKFFQKYTFVVLTLIVLLGGFLRFYQLPTIPPALNWDEVAFGYNAFSILHTGKDEYGTTMPLYLRSLDDYKRPVYTYATVVSVGLFGLSSFAVRLPAAFFGTLSILLIYFLAKELLGKKSVGLIASLFLAIAPWHIQFSHSAFEATIGFFLTGLGVLLTMIGMRKRPWVLPFASLSFGLALYSYLGQRVSVPLICLVLVILYSKKILNYLKSKERVKQLSVVIAACIMSIFAVSVLYDTIKPEGNLRFQATSIFTHSDAYAKEAERTKVDATLGINVPRKIFHDLPYLTSATLVAKGYLVHLSPEFLFFDFGQHHQAPALGNFYLWMLPFLIIGLYTLWKKEGTETKTILLSWILIPPLAGAVTFQVPHTLRVGDMLMPVTILIAYGAYTLYRWLRIEYRLLFYPLLGLLLAIGSFYLYYFLHEYYIHFPVERSKEWVYGRKEAALYAHEHEKDYDKIIVSTSMEYAYIFFLYYTQYDPAKYLAEGGTRSGGFAEMGNKFGKYEFHTIDYDQVPEGKRYLFIGKPDEVPTGITPLKKINYLNGEEAIYIVENNKQK